MLLRTSPFLRSDDEWIFDELTLKRIPAVPALARVLEHAALPVSPEKLLATVASRDELELLVRLGFLMEPDAVWRKTNVTMLELETSTHCNWRCRFCPTGFEPKPKESMSRELFGEILEKAVAHGTVTDVTFNSYNEPTLDALFVERVRMLAATPLRLRLHTNGSLLDERKIAVLAETRVLSFVLFNLPSIDDAEFRAATGSAGLERVLRNLDAAVAAGLPVGLSIQGTPDEVAARLPRFRRRYGKLLDNPLSRIATTHDRAGLLTNQYAENARVDDARLGGCNMVLRWLHIGVNGDCFICNQDYHQREVFGNVADGSFAEILASPRAQLVRKRVYGACDAPADYLCRTCVVMERSSRSAAEPRQDRFPRTACEASPG